MRPIVVFALVASWHFHQGASAQPQLWDVYSVSKQPFVNVTIDRFESDSLFMKAMNRVFVLHQDSVEYLLRKDKSQFALGFLIGAVV